MPTHSATLDLTVQAAEERGFRVDLEGFEAAMEAQRARGRQQVVWRMPVTGKLSERHMDK